MRPVNGSSGASFGAFGSLGPLGSLRASGVRRSDLRPLNAPSPLRVQTDARGRIVSLWRQGRLTPRAIASVQDRWRIDDEWWRDHVVSRMYYELILDDGTQLTVYHDLATGEWFEQRG
jgi:hypothetical protein